MDIHAQALGRLGGRRRSERKAVAARVNGKLGGALGGALGGRPRKYPPCELYGSHTFSPYTGKCPCGFHRPVDDSESTKS